MHKILSSACCALVLGCFPTVVFASAQNSALVTEQALLQGLDREFRAQMQQAGVPGAAYAVVRGQRIIGSGTFGVRAAGKADKIDVDTVFRLASVSKTFTGGLSVLAAEQGKLDLNLPLIKYVPEFKLKTAAATAQIKVDQVLSQSTGLMPHAYENMLEASQTPAQILPKFQQLLPGCRPGTCYTYQNIVFSLLDQVLRRGTGQSFDQLLPERIFKPLQMHTASVGYAPFLATKNKAEPHKKTANGWQPIGIDPNFYWVNPAAGVNASVTDMAKYLIAMLGHQPEVFSSNSLAMLQQPMVKLRSKPRWPVWQQFKQVSFWYGRGWRMIQYDQQQLFFHGGVVDGFRPYIAYSPPLDLGIVLLTNAEADVISEIAKWFWQQTIGQPEKSVAMQQVLRMPEQIKPAL
jgi:beta-lactamase class C